LLSTRSGLHRHDWSDRYEDIIRQCHRIGYGDWKLWLVGDGEHGKQCTVNGYW
jgi:hypothetical protein